MHTVNIKSSAEYKNISLTNNHQCYPFKECQAKNIKMSDCIENWDRRSRQSLDYQGLHGVFMGNGRLLQSFKHGVSIRRKKMYPSIVKRTLAPGVDF